MNLKFCRVLKTFLSVLEKIVYIVFTWLPWQLWQLLKGEVLFSENRWISAENTNYSSRYQIHNLNPIQAGGGGGGGSCCAKTVSGRPIKLSDF